jgi:hypothetical protein
MGGIDTSLIKKPESYGVYGTALGRSLLPSEVHGNLDVIVAAIQSMCGSLSPAQFGSRYGDATKQWTPQGTVYKQYPGMAAPTDLYMGTWEYFGQAGSTYASKNGHFERAEGGNASAFGAGEQGDAIRNITGTITFVNRACFQSAAGAFGASGSGQRPSNGEDSYKQVANFNAGYQVPTAVENRSINETVRIWICTGAPA